MPLFEAEVTESISRRVKYVVEAENADEAEEKLSTGDTVREEAFNEQGSVVDRTVTGPVTQVAVEASADTQDNG